MKGLAVAVLRCVSTASGAFRVWVVGSMGADTPKAVFTREEAWREEVRQEDEDEPIKKTSCRG